MICLCSPWLSGIACYSIAFLLSFLQPLVDFIDLAKYFTPLVVAYWFTTPLLTFAIAGRSLGFSSRSFAKDS
jgi:hypothetical protein